MRFVGLHICWGHCPHDQPEPPPRAAPQARWYRPTPIGLTAARQSMASGSAALLAGFSAATVGVIAQAPNMIRYPGWALFTLTFAAIALVACVQCGFNARARMYSYAEITEWLPHVFTADESESLRHAQIENARTARKWEWTAEWTYHIGIVCLAAGIGLVLIPMGRSDENIPRWLAAFSVVLGGVIQWCYYVRGWCKDKEARKQWADANPKPP